MNANRSQQLTVVEGVNEKIKQKVQLNASTANLEFFVCNLPTPIRIISSFIKIFS